MNTFHIYQDDEQCYRAICSRDARFDGLFFTGVLTTGIYCRPICPSPTPLQKNVRFFACTAAAEAAGFRACRRCHPEASPGSPEWNIRADLVARALQSIADGTVDAVGVSGLAHQLGVSERHMHRELVTEIGAGALTLARSRRAQTAKMLIDQTNLSVSAIAYTAGFTSIRQFNDTMQSIFGRAPSQLRKTPIEKQNAEDMGGTCTLKLQYRPPADFAYVMQFLERRAIPGVEEVANGRYRRTIAMPHSRGIIEIEPNRESGYIQLHLAVSDLRDLPAIVHLSKACFDLDADIETVQMALSQDELLAPYIKQHAGLRIPGTFNGFELAVRAILGQQISVAGARTIAGRIATALGDPIEESARKFTDGRHLPEGSTLTHYFPTAKRIAESDLSGLGITSARIRTLQQLATEVEQGRIILSRSVDRIALRDALLAIPGIGEWTASYIALRALGDPDAFMPTDLGILKAYAQMSQQTDQSRSYLVKKLIARAESWRPWRGYAMQYLWHSL